jgi:hypothetical protein
MDCLHAVLTCSVALLLCRVISLCIVQSDVFTQDHHSLAYTNGAFTWYDTE